MNTLRLPKSCSPRSSWLHLIGQFLFIGGLSALLPCAANAVPDASSPQTREAGLPFIDWFSPREYRGHSQIWAIAEDASGIFYFGNLNQVLVFDGARWTQLALPDAAFVRGLAIDDQDTLWVGGVDELGYAKSDATGARKFVSLKDKLPAEISALGAIWRIIATPDGVWFHAAHALLRWNGQAFDYLPLTTNSKRSLAQVGSEIWLTGSNNDWFKVSATNSELQLTPLPTFPEFRGNRVLGSAPTADAHIAIVATDSQGLWLWDGESFSLHSAPEDPSPSNNSIYGMTSLSDGRLVLNSLYSGIQIIDPNDNSHLRLDDEVGLVDPTAICSFPSHDGLMLWVGLANGIARVDVRPWLTHFAAANGLPNARIFAPTRFRDELYLPASAKGIYRLAADSNSTPAQFERVEAVDQLVNSATPVNDALMLATTNGFFAWDGHNPPQLLPDTPVNASAFIPLNSQPGTWGALDTTTVRLYQHNADGWHTDGPIPGLDQARSLIEDVDGSWWSGRPANGVLHTTFPHGFAHPVVTELTSPTSLPEGHGWTRFTADATGPLLACERGLFRYEATTQRFEPTTDYGTELADGSLGIFGLTPDDRGGLWLVVRPNDQQSTAPSYLNLLVYGHEGHMRRIHIPALSAIEDPTSLQFEPARPGLNPATLWIAGQAALVRVDLERWQKSPPSPQPQIFFRELKTASGRTLDLRGGWELANEDRSLFVQLASPALGHDSAAVYESTLRSSNAVEVRTSHRPDREFSALGPGTYTLEARARPPGGIWSEPISLAFSVRPPWWLSPVALFAYLLIVSLIIWLAWNWRTAHLRRLQRRLENLVSERTAELAAQNAELMQLRQIDIDEKLAARLAEHQARLEVLRYQLNPHFLFNTLNAICAQIIRSPRTARETVIRLAEFCRLTLHRPHENEDPTVAQEVAMLRAYLEIEQTRMGDLLHYEIKSDPDLNSLSLPPFLLLPLIENAVKHGAATSEDSLRIRVSIARELDGAVLIEVANTGLWTTPEEPPTSVPSLGIGLENLRQRLIRYFPQRHELTQNTEPGWVIMRLRLTTPDVSLSSALN